MGDPSENGSLEPAEPPLTPYEIQIINAARTVLLEIDVRSRMASLQADYSLDGFNYGRLAQVAYDSHALLFTLLNVADSYCEGDLTHQQLHNDPAEVLTLGKPRPKPKVVNDKEDKKEKDDG